jgi:hypothetical protein
VAEILIQHRRHRKVWPWLLGLLVLSLLPLPFVVADRDDDRPTRPTARRDTTQRDTAERDTTTRQDTIAQPLAAAPPVAAIGAGDRRAAAENRTAAPGNRTATTAGGSVAPPAAAAPSADATTFERFIASRKPNANEREHVRFTAEGLRRLADELRALGASGAVLRAIRANADSLMRISPRRTGHADYARAAFLAAVREFDILRGRYGAAVDTGRLRAAAWAIEPRPSLHAQRGRVQTFFESARDALHALSRSASVRRGR